MEAQGYTYCGGYAAGILLNPNKIAVKTSTVIEWHLTIFKIERLHFYIKNARSIFKKKKETYDHENGFSVGVRYCRSM